MKKRIISIILVVMLLLVPLTSIVSAADSKYEEYYKT